MTRTVQHKPAYPDRPVCLSCGDMECERGKVHREAWARYERGEGPIYPIAVWCGEKVEREARVLFEKIVRAEAERDVIQRP